MRAYVTGGTGFVGSNIVKVFAERHGAAVHCPVHRFVPADARGFTTERLDLLDDGAVRASVAAFGPDVIVHSMILNDFAAMYADRELAWRSYVGTTEILAQAADEAGAKLILVSTDWMFDGTQSGADEDTPPNPVGEPLRGAQDGQRAGSDAERRAGRGGPGVGGQRHGLDARVDPPGAGHWIARRRVSSSLMSRLAVRSERCCDFGGRPRRFSVRLVWIYDGFLYRFRGRMAKEASR